MTLDAKELDRLQPTPDGGPSQSAAPCPACGEAVRPGSLICVRCGMPLGRTAQRAVRRGPSLAILLVVLVLIAIAVVVGVFLGLGLRG